MSIRKKILLLFAVIVALSGVIAWQGYQAYIDIIKQHEIVDLREETANAANRLSEAIYRMRIEAVRVGGEAPIRSLLQAADPADAGARPPEELAVAEQRLGDMLLKQPAAHYVWVRLLADDRTPLVCVLRDAWKYFPPGETAAERGQRVANQTPESFRVISSRGTTDPPPEFAADPSLNGHGHVRMEFDKSIPLLVATLPIEVDGQRLGYVEIAKDFRYEIFEQMMTPRLVTIVTDERGCPELTFQDATARPVTDEPIEQFVAQLAAAYASTDAQYDFASIDEFAPPRGDRTLSAYQQLFTSSFLVARYPNSEWEQLAPSERHKLSESLGGKIERGLNQWRSGGPGRRFFNASVSLERDPRIVVCAPTSQELDAAARVLREASGNALEIDRPRATSSYAVKFQKIYWDPSNRDHYLGLIRAASIQEIEADVRSELWRKTRWALILIPLALGLISMWGPGFIARPLANITQGAERISRGDLRQVDVPRANDEIGRLARAFNNMVAALSERRELKAANLELEKAKRDLERAQASREEFLASVSHELRTPLTTVLGFCDRLRKTELTSRQQSDVDRIRFAGERLLRLVKDILDYQKVVMGRLPLEPCKFDLARLIRDIVEDNRPRAAEKGIGLRLEADFDELAINADPGRIAQVVENLIGNSLKFTTQGEITCRVRRRQREGTDYAVVEVQDTGRGMTDEQQAQLFRPFTKILDNSENPTGTGLGLAIARGICRASGGDLNVDASRTAVGSGSTFVVELPLSPVGFSTTWVSPLATESDLGLAGSGRLALVIDDDPDVAELLRGFFLEHDFQVTVATTGVNGLEEAKRLRPALITLDVQMPGLDGWQVLRLLKSEPATADIPVVLVTIADDKRRGFALGASEYITKPIDWNRLGELVERYRHNAAPSRVLVVEDDADQRALLVAGLREKGCDVVEAANGQVALDALEDFVPDLILLDLIMPEMDGFQFLAALRDHSELRDATVVVISGKELDDSDRDRLRGQVSDIIAKGEATWGEIQTELQRLLAINGKRITVTR